MTAKGIKLIIEFPDAATALEWFDAEQEEGHVPAGTEVYKADSLDLDGGTAGHYVIRTKGTRLAHQALRRVQGNG